MATKRKTKKVLKTRFLSIRLDNQALFEFDIICQNLGIDKSKALRWFMYQVITERVNLNVEKMKNDLKSSF